MLFARSLIRFRRWRLSVVWSAIHSTGYLKRRHWPLGTKVCCSRLRLQTTRRSSNEAYRSNCSWLVARKREFGDELHQECGVRVVALGKRELASGGS